MNDKFWHCLPKTQFSDPFYLPEGRSNTMKGRSGEAEGLFGIPLAIIKINTDHSSTLHL